SMEEHECSELRHDVHPEILARDDDSDNVGIEESRDVPLTTCSVPKLSVVVASICKGPRGLAQKSNCMRDQGSKAEGCCKEEGANV
ncbi:hypothetical protein U1Q18_023160, partial [Sarracenia purpurea var. burkii]